MKTNISIELTNDERLTQTETLAKATAKNPKIGRKLLNEMEQ